MWMCLHILCMYIHIYTMTWRSGPPKNNTFACWVEKGHYTFLYPSLLGRLIDCYRRQLFLGLSLCVLFIQGKHPHFVTGCSMGSGTWMIKIQRNHHIVIDLVGRFCEWVHEHLEKSFNHYLILNMSKWKFYMCLAFICVTRELTKVWNLKELQSLSWPYMTN